MILPMPKEMAAATMPNRTCRKPERTGDLPVMKVMAAPMPKSPIALVATLATMPAVPVKKR